MSTVSFCNRVKQWVWISSFMCVYWNASVLTYIPPSQFHLNVLKRVRESCLDCYNSPMWENCVSIDVIIGMDFTILTMITIIITLPFQ